MAKIEIARTELVWPGKYDEKGELVPPRRVSLPFQVIERVNETRATREQRQEALQGHVGTLFDYWQFDEGQSAGPDGDWRNKLIWGDDLYVMGSLLEHFAGQTDLIYIDPPFATGADFSVKTQIGGEEIIKEQSIIEEKAYRDTWGRGIDSYLQMLHERLMLMRDLLAETGAILVHADVHMGPYIKAVLDEIFGQDNFLNAIAWYYYNKLHDSRKRLLPKAFDLIFYYVKNRESDYTYHRLEEKRDRPVKKLRYQKVDGKIQNVIGPDGKAETYIRDMRVVDNVWRIRCLQPANKREWVDFETQKPVDLVERVLQVASDPGDLVLDAFLGSGTTAIAAERQRRRWIGVDIGRYAIHLTRKRLLDEPNCRPFEILNLGQYERQVWQGMAFGGQRRTEQMLIFEYLKFILDLYGAQPLPGTQHLHGKKSSAVVHVGAVDAPVTIDEVLACLAECRAMGQKELHVLGWEWEMGLSNLMVDEARGQGIRLLLLTIPREVMEQQAVDKGDIHFYELAYLEVEIKPSRKKHSYTVALTDFVIPNDELIPPEVRRKIAKWSDYVDYWAVDWDFQNDTFVNGWTSYRTRRDRTLQLKSDSHVYEAPGTYHVLVKVIDIFGNDTSQVYEVEVA
jgi:adenine-specific DNA-methyltransferase